jgi:hypothetical protein
VCFKQANIAIEVKDSSDCFNILLLVSEMDFFGAKNLLTPVHGAGSKRMLFSKP